MALLFSYGTLRLPRVQREVFGRLIAGEPDAIAGHRLGEVTITDPEVIRASGSAVHPMLLVSGDPADQVPGTVFDLDDVQLAAADAYEVDAYARRAFPLVSGRTAWVYTLADRDAGPDPSSGPGR